MRGKILGAVIVASGALAVGLAFASKSEAQCGVPYRRVVVSQPYVAPYVAPYVETVVREIVTPIAVPILVPAFQFQYQPPCGTCAPVVNNQPGFIPGYGVPGGGAQAGFGGAQAGFNSQGSGMPVQGSFNSQGSGMPVQGGAAGFNSQPLPSAAREGVVNTAGSQESIKELARALLDEIQKQQGGPDANDNGPPVVVDPSVPRGPPVAPPPAGGRTVQKQSAQENRAALAQFSIGALQRNCAACHTGLGSKGDTVIFTQPGVINPQSPWRTMAREIQAGRMPPRSSQYRPTPQESQGMLSWLATL